MKRRTLFTLLGVAGLFISAFFTSCYPGDDVSYSDLDLVITAHDQDMNFSQLNSYYLYDSVVHIKDTLDEDSNVDISREFDGLILNLVKENMNDYGYNYEEDPETNKPDVVVTVSAMASKNTYVYYYYPYYYYGWGWGWYYKDTEYYGWGWYYPPYWGGAYVTSYTVGTLIINMHDVRNATSITDTIPTLWNCAINGLLGSSSSTAINRLDYNINQGFKQSTYLQTN